MGGSRRLPEPVDFLSKVPMVQASPGLPTGHGFALLILPCCQRRGTSDYSLPSCERGVSHTGSPP